ncbi:MAG: 23S rRNA (adenine(2503)-C(2))-methyltransferase RlmN [Dehalococcoidia bacterium]|nr:23S rRNA (adenine(2503)-C(2))-methyltransferase RlmN [Dehalococcoidia bacterium]
MNKVALYNLNFSELSDLLKSWGAPSYHADQLWKWLYRPGVGSFDAMTDLPLQLRARLADKTSLNMLTPVQEEVSRDGETTKVLFRLRDGDTIESVSMRQPSGDGERHTVCVSTQAGCPIRCPFCATGQQGFRRDLSAGELVEQVVFFAKSMPDRPVTNVVFMGMGEPLINYNATIKAIHVLNSPQGFKLGARHMTISTAGMVPGIKALAKEEVQVGLAISLHASNDRLRDSLVPLNRRYPLKELISACRDYFNATGRRVTFEYTLFQGINDSSRLAVQLAKLIKGTNSHVNLIPANPTPGGFPPSPRDRIIGFCEELKRNGIGATIRRSQGSEIQAGCGQLRGRIVTTSEGSGYSP